MGLRGDGNGVVDAWSSSHFVIILSIMTFSVSYDSLIILKQRYSPWFCRGEGKAGIIEGSEIGWLAK